MEDFIGYLVFEGGLGAIQRFLLSIDWRLTAGLLLAFVLWTTRAWWRGTLLAPALWGGDAVLWAAGTALWLARKIHLPVILGTGLASGLIAVLLRYVLSARMPADEALSLALLVWLAGWLTLFAVYLVGEVRSTRGSW